jgi:hypothetical protein
MQRSVQTTLHNKIIRGISNNAYERPSGKIPYGTEEYSTFLKLFFSISFFSSSSQKITQHQ